MAVHALIEFLKHADTEADAHVQAILALPHPTPEEVTPHVRGYILAKFLLREEDAAGAEELRDLASASISRALDLAEGDLAVTDLSDRCAAAPSVETKLVLLMMRLEKALHVKLDVMERVNAHTVEELSCALCAHLNQDHLN